MLTQTARGEFDHDGFTILRGFAPAATCQAMLDDVVGLCAAMVYHAPNREPG